MTDQVLLDIVEGSITHAARSGGGFSVARAMAFDQLQRNGLNANYDYNDVDAALNEALGVAGTPKALGDPVPEDGPLVQRDVNALAGGTPKPLGLAAPPTQKPLGQLLPE